MKHIVGLSGGKDSTCLALWLRENMPDTDFDFICTPTGNELPAMIDHWLHLGELLGKSLTFLSCGHSLDGLIRLKNCLPNHRIRYCTRTLKIEPYLAYLAKNAPAVSYIGLRADEADREGTHLPKGGGDVYGAVTGVTQRFPLREQGFTTAMVWDYLAERGVTIPDRTDCDCCFWQTIAEWYLLWKRFPDRYARAERYEAQTGHTFRSEQRDTWPAGLAGLRAEFERGRPIPNLNKYIQTNLGMSGRTDMCRACSL